MGAPLEFNEFETFFFFFFFFSRSSSGFCAFRIWKSPIASRSTEHRAAAFSYCSLLTSSETDLVIRRLFWSFSSVIVVEEGLAFDWES